MAAARPAREGESARFEGCIYIALLIKKNTKYESKLTLSERKIHLRHSVEIWKQMSQRFLNNRIVTETSFYWHYRADTHASDQRNWH